MEKLFKNINKRFSIKELIYLALTLLMSSLIISFSLLFYSTSIVEEFEEILEQVLKVEKQNNKINTLSKIINENKINIFISKTEDEFDLVEKKLVFEVPTFDKVFFKNFESKNKDYNELLQNIEYNLSQQIVIQNNFFTINSSLFITNAEIIYILDYYEKSINKIKVFLNKMNENNIYTDVLEYENITKSLLRANKNEEIISINQKLIIQKNSIFSKLRNNLLKNEFLKLDSYTSRLLIKVKSNIKTHTNLIKSFSKEKKLNQKLNHNLFEIKKLIQEINSIYLNNMQEKSFFLKMIILFVGILSVIFLIIFTFALIYRINKPLEIITKKIKEISTDDSKLSENITVKYNDEYGLFADYFNKMTDKLALTIKDLQIKEKKISKMNKNLEKIVEQRTKELVQKSQKVSDLLNNASQGFLSFSKTMKIDKEYSKECEKFLEDNLEDKDIISILFSNKKEFYKDTLIDALEEENDVISQSYLRLLPQEIILNRRALQLEYKILDNKRYMLIMTNISTKKRLEKKIKLEQERVAMIVSIISNSDEFYETIDSFKKFLINLDIFTKSTINDVDKINYYYREMHTYKGLFSQVYMSNLKNYLHELESKIIEIDVNKNISSLKNILNKEELEEKLAEDLAVIKASLGEDFLNDKDFIKIESNKLHLIESITSSLYKKDSENLIFQELQTRVKRLKQKSFNSMFNSFNPLCKEQAKKLNKELYPIVINSDSKLLIPQRLKSFNKSLIHLFRNILDHGIEELDERLLKNKDSIGTIECTCIEEEGSFLISILDDGAGINLTKIKEIALLNKIYTSKQIDELAESELFLLIFKDNFSTKDEVSELSGRGVGLAVIKKEIEKLNGNIEVESTKDLGTKFIFTIPKENNE